MRPQSARADWPDFVLIGVTEAKNIADSIWQGFMGIQAVLLQNTVSGVGNQMATATEISTKGIIQVSQNNQNAGHQNQINTALMQTNAGIGAEAVLGSTSVACTIAAAGQANNGTSAAAAGAAETLGTLGGRIGTGASANETAPAASAERICGLVGNGWTLFDPSSGLANVAKSLNCTGASGISSNTKYYPSDIDSVAGTNPDHLQFPIPKNMTPTADGHVMFKDATANYDTPWKDEVRFIAAFKFCERLRGVVHAPTFNGSTLKDSDLEAIESYLSESSDASTPYKACLKELTYRMACPTGSALVGSTIDCHKQQVEACHLLKDPIKAVGNAGSGTGQGVGTLSYPAADQALASCDDNGLSQAMIEYINAHKCQSYNNVSNLGATIGKASDIEQSQARCDMTINQYDEKMEQHYEHIREVLGSGRRDKDH
jgi:hypothetical protein